MYTHVLFKCVCTVVSPTHCIHENLCSNCWIKIHNQHLFKKEEKKKTRLLRYQPSCLMLKVGGHGIPLTVSRIVCMWGWAGS